MTTRVVDPWALRSTDGNWYLVGHCHRAGDRRVFRVDRIDALERTGERVPEGSVDPRPDEPIAPAAEATRARIRIPASRRWLLDTVVVDEIVEAGDHLEVVLPVSAPAPEIFAAPPSASTRRTRSRTAGGTTPMSCAQLSRTST